MGLNREQVKQPIRTTEISQGMNDLAQINNMLLNKLNLLGEKLQSIRTSKPQNLCETKDNKALPQPCKLADEIKQRTTEIAQAVTIINLILEEIEL